MKKIDAQLKKISDTSGIYLFYNKKKELIYVGKATSLKNRVRSYFRGRNGGRPIERFIAEVIDIKWKEADSVLEAIILEANYIKKFLPKYNVLGRDDKSWNYLYITDDEYPRVVPMRQHEIDQQSKQNKQIRQSKHLFGPYPGLNTKATMKLLRRMFYISDCRKQQGLKRKRRDPSTSLRSAQDDVYKPCLYRQMGLCLGVCTREISPTEYKKKVIRPLVSFLKGGKKRLISTLNRRMKEAAKAQEYEEAARLRNQISSLERIHDVALLNKSFFFDNVILSGAKNPEEFNTSEQRKNGAGASGSFTGVQDDVRIEGYDISNLGSTGKVGSMVVFDTGGPVKSEYRKFKIKTVVGQSDVDCLEEVLMRRLKHDDWPMPSVLMIDGGKPQVHRAKEVVRRFGFDIPIIGIAKGAARKKNEFVFGIRDRWFIKWVNANQDLLIQVRDEAHRFAIAYQRKLRKLK